MGRTRFIKPKFFTNEYLAETSIHARLLYLGLTTEADRDGILQDRPAKIKINLLPWDNVDIDAAIDELCKAKNHDGIPFLVRYRVEGVGYLFLPAMETEGKPWTNEPSNGFPKPALSLWKKNIEGTLRELSGKVEPTLAESSYKTKELKTKNKKLKADASKKDQTDLLEIPNDVETVFSAYVKSWNRTDKYQLTTKRKDWIKKALRQKGLTLCLEGVKRFRADSYEQRAEFNDIEYLFGKDKRIDRWCRADAEMQNEGWAAEAKRNLKKEGLL